MSSNSIQPAAPEPISQGNSRVWLVWGALVAVLCFSIFVRCRLITLPLERDEGEYAYGGQLLVEHRGQLYRDVHTLKWPGVFAMYAAGFLVGGQSIVEIRTQLLLLNVITAAGVFLLSSELMRRREAVFATAAFLVMSLLPCLQGLIANAEHFVNLFAVYGWWLLARSIRLRQWPGLAASGFLMGMSLCMKQHAMFGVAMGGILAACSADPRPHQFWKTKLLRLTLYCCGVGIAMGTMLLAIWLHGAWAEFWRWTILYSRDYTGQVLLKNAPILLIFRLEQILPDLLPFCLLGGTGLWWAWRSNDRRRRMFAMGMLVAGLLATTPGFYFRDHYFLLVLPGLAVIAALGLEAATSSFSSPRRADSILALILGVSLVWPLLRQRDLLLWQSVNQTSRTLYGPNPFIESIPIADYLRNHMAEDETVVIFGSEPQIAFYADRKLASGYIYMYPLMERHPLALTMQRDFIREVKDARPRYAVMVNVRTSWLVRPDSEKLVLNWMKEFFHDYETCGEVRLKSPDQTDYEFTDGVLELPPATSDSIRILRRRS